MASFSFPESRQRQILIGLGVAVVLVAWTNLFFLPQRKVLRELGPQVKSLRREMTKVRQALARQSDLEGELSRLSGEAQRVGVFSPEEQLPELLGQITQLAKETGVKLHSVKPKKRLSELAAGPSGFLELPIQLEASAGYHQIGAFLDRLEQSEILFRTEEMTIEPDRKNLFSHQVNLLLLAYLSP